MRSDDALWFEHPRKEVVSCLTVGANAPIEHGDESSWLEHGDI